MSYFKRNASTSVTNMSKQDIREIPFDRLFFSCYTAAKTAEADAEEVRQDVFTEHQEKMVRDKVAFLAATLPSSDGLEESIREGLPTSPEPMSEDDKRTIREKEYVKECEAFALTYSLKKHSQWLPAQLMATIAQWKPVRCAEDSAKFSPVGTFNASLGSKDASWLRGTYMFMMYSKRGNFVSPQNKAPGVEYSALVPMLLAGFLKYHNIPYDAWDVDSLEKLLEPALYDAITCDVPDDLTAEELLSIRELGVTIKSGDKAGEQTPITSAYKLNGIGGTRLAKLPWLAQVMLTQIWVANPALRTKYMILDPVNWTEMPKPLVDSLVQRAVPNTRVPRNTVDTHNISLDDI